MDDRIDALLADIEAADDACERHARRGEFGDELASQASERTLSQRLRGALGRTVRVVLPKREVIGTVVFLGRDILVVTGAETTVIAIAAIRELRLPSRTHRFSAGGLERLGMGSALRRWAAVHAHVTIDVADRPGFVCGRCDMVGADYVDVAGRIVPFAAITAVQSDSNPFG